MQLRSVVHYWSLAMALSMTPLTGAGAAVYCVNNPTELQSALSAAAASSSDDEVRLVRGVYGPAQTLVYNSQNPGWVFVLGGYDVGCGGRSGDARTTVLDGGLARQVLQMTFNPPGATAQGPRIGVDNFTVQNGVAAGFTRGGGIALASYGTAQAELWVDNLIVRNNSGYFSGGINLYTERGLIRVANSLFDGNTAPSSAFGHLATVVNHTEAVNGTGVIIANSTFVNGSCAGQDGRGCGIGLSLPTGIRADVINSLFSNNAISDVNIENGLTTGGSASIDYSLVGAITGNLAPIITNPVSGDPGFVDAVGGDFHLRDNSALINRGLGVPPYYAFNSFDIDGNPRVRSAALDVGAYENQNMMFGNGFE